MSFALSGLRFGFMRIREISVKALAFNCGNGICVHPGLSVAKILCAAASLD
jgi:hypothetical protein